MAKTKTKFKRRVTCSDRHRCNCLASPYGVTCSLDKGHDGRHTATAKQANGLTAAIEWQSTRNLTIY